MGIAKYVFVGIRGSVMALDRNTGEIIWETHLNGDGLVMLVLVENSIYATTHGELFCIEAFTGRVRWGNSLKGYGTAIATIATAGSIPVPAADLFAASTPPERRPINPGDTDTIFID